MVFVKVVASSLLAASFFSIASCAQSDSTPSITNHQSEGNLESKSPIGCIAAADVKNTYTPADLYNGVASCVAADDLKNGPLLYALAGVYGRFDTLRVTDRTSHQALTVIQMQELGSLTQEETDRLRQEVVSMGKDDARLDALCAQIRQIGSPNYAPRYMVQHGMGAFLSGSGTGVDATFDGAAAWEKALTSYLRCPAASVADG